MRRRGDPSMNGRQILQRSIQMLRSIIAVLSGPVVYGVLCVPIDFLVVTLFPSHFNEHWVTDHTGILALLVSLTIIYAGASGFVCAMLARHHVVSHVTAMAILQLAIGIAVQSQSWTVLPVWYHYTFFVLLISGILMGAALRVSTVRNTATAARTATGA